MINKPDIRAWARENGFEVKQRGRLAPAIHAAYQKVFGAPDPTTMEAPPGAARCHCGRAWTGMSECHCRRCHVHFSGVRAFDEHFDRKSQCVDPLSVTYTRGAKAGEPKFKHRASAWGPIVCFAHEDREFSGDGQVIF